MSDNPIHYSQLYFRNTVIKGGYESIPSPKGGIEIGHFGNGCILIRKLTHLLCSNQINFFSYHFLYYFPMYLLISE